VLRAKKRPKLWGHPNQKPRKYKTLAQKNTQELDRVAWEWFSKYVRLRDSVFKDTAWYGTCISCSHSGRVAHFTPDGKLHFDLGWDAGHYIKRGRKVVKYNEMNVNLQCKNHCNKWLNGNPEKYRPALQLKYGDEVPDELEKLDKATPYYKFSKDELMGIITDSKTQLEYLIKIKE